MSSIKAFFADFKHYRFLLSELVKKGIKLKYRRSYLGIIWTLLEPLLTMIVLSVVFGNLYGRDDATFPIYVLCGRLLYGYFSRASSACVKCIRLNAPMIKKVYVPKYLYPLSAVMSNYVTFALSLIVLVGVSLVLGVFPSVYWLLIVIPLALLFLLTLGCSLILATLGVFFRDMEYLWEVVLMIIMYLCAIFYSPERLIGSKLMWLLEINPLFCIISNFRSCIFGEMLNWSYCAYAFGFAAAAIILGSWMFHKLQDKFILHI